MQRMHAPEERGERLQENDRQQANAVRNRALRIVCETDVGKGSQ